MSSKQLIELSGIVAIVLSLLFVGYELRQSRSIALTQMYESTAELTRSLHEFIGANADVWARGCMAEELTSSENVLFRNIARSVVHYNFTRFGRSNIGIANAPVSSGPRRVASNAYNFPGFKEVWDIVGNNYNPLFRDAVNEQYQLLLESGEAKTSDVAMCGR